ncbi:hypothetical protein EJD97_009572, partial [Solanum chilense]
ARQMLCRPPKNRRREIGEVRKDGKLPRMGTIIRCSICKGPNHNKRNCPNNPKHKSTPTPTHESTIGKKRGRGHYERASTSKTDIRNNNTGKKRGAENGYKKRPKVVGQGIFVVDTGYMCTNQGLSTSRRVNTSVVSSAHL